MDNSKVLKPIIGPQESAESKKKESNKKKKALLVSALAFLIATGTIAASIAVVKANMPKLEIKFDDWFVDSFDFDSMQAFIDENRLSKGDIDKQLPGYVDKKAKDQNVKNADMITNARLTNKIPEDKNNKLPKGIYVEMTAEIDYAFAYQADLSLEESNENTKQLSNITEEPKKPRYYISKDKSKLFVLVYERETDSDEATQDDLKTFNDYHITNTYEAFTNLNKYIGEQSRRYTEEEFTSNSDNYQPGLEIFYDTLIGFEKQYISKDTDAITFPEENGQKVVKIKLDVRRSNFYFDENNPNVKFEIKDNEGFITISNLSYFSVSTLTLTNLHTEIQNYIKAFDPDNNIDNRYTLEEFRNQMGDTDLRVMILKSVGIIKDNPITLDETITDPDNPGEVEPEEPTPPVIDTSKLNNMYIRDNNLVIEFKCDANQKYGVSEESGFDSTKYSFDQVNNRLTVKNLKYFIEYDVKNTQSSWFNLNKEIVNTNNQYTPEEFISYVDGVDTQQQCKELIAKGLTANGNTFEADWISELSVEKVTGSDTKIKLKIELDTDFKKYKTDENEQYKIDSKTSSMEIQFTCFKQVEMNNLQHDIQEIINAELGPRYTVEEFGEQINHPTNSEPEALQNKIKGLVETNIQGATNIGNFNYSQESNELKFELTIPAYDKFPPSGSNIEYKLLRKNTDDTTTYIVTITNLEYWFDFSITADELRKTKEVVGKFILKNNVYLSDDPDDQGNYHEYEKQIYDLFGKAELENGMLLSNFMTYSQDDFKLIGGNNFFINLKPKIDSAGRLRKFIVPKELNENDGIEISKDNKTIIFNKFQFGVRKDYFFINEKAKMLIGVTSKGRKQTVLRTLDGYPKIGTSNEQIDGYDNKIAAWNWIDNLKEFYISDDVEEIIGGNFIYEARNLEHIKMSRNMFFPDTTQYINNNNSFSKLHKIKTIDWNQNKHNDVMNSRYAFGGTTSLKSFIFPRTVTDIKRQNIIYSNKNLEYYIAWFNNFRCEELGLGLYCPKLKNIVILSNDFNITGVAGYRNSGFFSNYLRYNDVTIYVISEAVKQKMISNKKNLFGPDDVETSKLQKQIQVIPNLEQKLIDDGVIPQDW